MGTFSDEGRLYKATETVRTLVARRPSLGTLLANRRQHFQRAHAILPSTAVVGERLSLTVQARDQCERLVEDFRGSIGVHATDGEASCPERVVFPPNNGGVTVETGLAFETPDIHYLPLTDEATGEQFVSNPVRVTAEEPEYRLYWGDIHLHSKLSDGCGVSRTASDSAGTWWPTPTTTRWAFSSRRDSSVAGCASGTSTGRRTPSASSTTPASS